MPLPLGRSAITATIVGPGGEDDPSGPISVVFSNVPPALILAAPTASAVINGGTFTVSGRTRTGSTVVVRNDNTRKSTNAVATNGYFSIPVALGPGPNDLTITATDPAGNTTTKTLTVIGGSGQTTVTLHLSNARLALTSLPTAISMVVTVLGMNGAPLDGAQVAFTLQVPGVTPVTYQTPQDQRDGDLVHRDPQGRCGDRQLPRHGAGDHAGRDAAHQGRQLRHRVNRSRCGGEASGCPMSSPTCSCSRNCLHLRNSRPAARPPRHPGRPLAFVKWVSQTFIQLVAHVPVLVVPAAS